MPSLENNRLATAARLVVIAALGLVLLGCGAGASAPVATSSAAAVTPTPVPTTAPLSLPTPDASLPALAPLPAALPTSQPVVTAPAAETEAVPVPVDQAGTPAAAEEDAAVPVAGTPASASEPAAPIEPAPEAQDVLVTASADRWSDCVLLAADSTQSTALLDPIAAGTATDMSSVQLNALAAASVGCDLVSSGLITTDVGDYVPTAAACVNAWLESSGGGGVFVGLASVGWGQSVPVWAQSHFVDALDSCFTGASFAADVMSVVSADSSLTGAFDSGCLATSFDSSGTMRSFAQSLAANPTAATINVSLSDAWVLSCANVGQMVAVAAAADGVALSGSTISCIDSELKGTGVVASLVAGTADTDAVGIATIACLTDSEASALLG